jgi:hypothetical protein
VIYIVETCQDPNQSASKALVRLPSLFPAYLSLQTQHHLLVKIQTILEQACFEFGQQAMPDILEKNEWDCPESGELNIWTAEFLKRQGAFDKKRDVGKPLEKLFRSVADIRHAAVHRIRVSARGIEQFMLDAESLATLLGHVMSLAQLSKLRRETQMVIEELERNKHVLSSKLGETLESIAAQRVKLDHLEKAAISDMLKEDGDYQHFAGINLMEAIAAEESTALSSTATEKGINCDLEDEESVDNDDESSWTSCQD